MKIVIVRPDHVGDLLLTTPLARCLAKAGHRVEMLVRRANTPILEHNPHVAATWALEDASPGYPARWWELAGWLRRQRYDVALLAQSRPRTLLLAALAAGIPRRLAMWSGVAGRLALHTCLRSGLPGRLRHMADITLDLARALGVPEDGTGLDFVLTDAERAWAAQAARARLGERPLVGIHPGCRGNTCNLPAAEYGRLAAAWLGRNPGIGVVVTGTADEAGLLGAWPPEALQSTRLWNAVGQLSLRQLGALVERMRVYVVVGTGPLHLASALGVRTVSPFCASGPLSPQVWGNAGGPGVAVEPPPAYCAQRRRRRASGHCDFGGHVTAGRLLDAGERILSAAAPPG